MTALGLDSTATEIGEWMKGPTLRRVTHHKNTTTKELRAQFKGNLKPCKMTGKRSPKQSAKVRWKKQRRRRFEALLGHRDYVRNSPFLRMMKYPHLLGVEDAKFNWFERSVA